MNRSYATKGKNRQNVMTIFSKEFRKRKGEMDLAPLYFSISNLLKESGEMSMKETQTLILF